jgi:hypothetical protein
MELHLIARATEERLRHENLVRMAFKLHTPKQNCNVTLRIQFKKVWMEKSVRLWQWRRALNFQIRYIFFNAVFTHSEQFQFSA